MTEMTVLQLLRDPISLQSGPKKRQIKGRLGGGGSLEPPAPHVIFFDAVKLFNNIRWA